MASARESLWESGHDESVEVNQRALIDKVLARYSGEFTVFRELLQNSDDAGSKSVEIRFETKGYLESKKNLEKEQAGSAVQSGGRSGDRLPDLKTTLVHQWTFRNNGMIFRDEDWNRLKKIAEGNPDEEKIGAFGVGFYSLFSITDEPFVTSGGQWMGFYWKDKKDQLFARRGTLPVTSTDTAQTPQWTSFEMPLREAAPIPLAFDFTRFLTSSITFMVHLREVSVFFDNHRLARLSKDPGVASLLGIPKGLKASGPFGMMHVKAIHSTPLHIKADVMRGVYTSGTSNPTAVTQASKALKPTVAQSGFFSSLLSSLASASATPTRATTPLPQPASEAVDPLAILESTVVLAIFSADVDVKIEKKFALELHRSTKKNPPNTLRLDLIYTGKSEYDASKREDEQQDRATGSIFQGLRADLDGTGSARVFIGHATGQTTGIGGHIAARFIPTVERESIDLVDRNVSMWNKELLYVGGFLARAAYELEMNSIRDLWIGAAESSSASKDDSAPDSELQAWLRGRCLHALKFFTFNPSTPSSTVSHLLEAGFFASAVSHPFYIMSSTGIKTALEVRIPDPVFSGFLKQLPVLPDEIMSGARTMVEALRTRGMIKDITFVDVLEELKARPLDETELVACMKWWAGMQSQGSQMKANLSNVRQNLINAAVLVTGVGTPDEKIIPLLSLRTFVNSRTMGALFPLDGPLPEHTLPVSISRSIPPNDLMAGFGWQELNIIDWTRYIASPAASSNNAEFDLSTSAFWAERVLNVLARAWPSLASPHQAEIVDVLHGITCIPTRSGMKVPEHAYFANANIFPDLPVVMMPKGSIVKGALERVLLALGVRKHVELQVVFDRMIKTGDWTISDLIKYLVAVQQTLTPVELDRLRKTAAFPEEKPPGSLSTGNHMSMERRIPGDLYEPLDVFRELRLPVIDWGTQTRWRASSEEAKFLFLLGLRRYPPLRDILSLAANPDASLRSVALKYFLDNHSRYPDYDPVNFANLSFVPAIRPDGQTATGSPNEIFVDPESAVLGFSVVHPSVRDMALDKLKLRKFPPTSLIVPLLEKSAPQSPVVVRQWFEVLAGHVAEFSSVDLARLSQMAIVPAQQLPSSEGEPVPPIRMKPPKECYFKRDSDQNFHSQLFVFVDFGTRANAFLSACGTKSEPSVEEIAEIMLSDPRRFFRLVGGREHYMMELRNIAVNRRALSGASRSQMKKVAVFLGSRRVKVSTDSNAKNQAAAGSAELDEDEWDMQYDLLKPDQIVIADDTNGYQVFGDSVFSAPQEDLLEDFYAEFGSPRLSSLIREDYKTTAEIKDAKVSKEIRALILERLPLFLHEHTYARPRVQFNWLNNEKHFVVKTFGKLTVHKHIFFGGTRMARTQDASAATRRQGKGPIELWLAGNTQVDMYEVAISLCRVLFDMPKVNDALLFMTILSTDLRALRRRGYNVDRILKQQKAAREAEEVTRHQEGKELEKLLSDFQPPVPGGIAPTPGGIAPTPGGIPPAVPTSTRPIPDGKHIASPDHPVSPEHELLNGNGKKGHRPQSAFVNSLQSLKRKLIKNENIFSEAGPSRPTARDGTFDSDNRPLPSLPGRENGVVPIGPRVPQEGITPQSNISANIEQAIAACREEQSHLLHNREEMRIVKESMEEGYCDVSGRVGDLDYIGAMADVKVYVSKGVPNGRTILDTRRNAIARFIHVIQPLRAVYKLPPTSVHIFYDLQGETIAFNRNASIFLNLRYYEAWHDAEVERGDLSKAFISWYFTLAHEIAHNLVQPHNSEHEFWFSSICEAHVLSLGRLLGSRGASGERQ